MLAQSHAALVALLLAAMLPSCRSGPRPGDSANRPAAGRRLPPPLPDTTGLGTHVLSIRTAPDGAVWVGTLGGGIRVLEPAARAWRVVDAAGGEAISGVPVNAFAFPADGSVWYGTVGGGFGRSTDGGTTWTTWGSAELGPDWAYVAPEGIDADGDTVYAATAAGLRITWDRGASWRCVLADTAADRGGRGRLDGCTESVRTLPTGYLLALDVAADGTIWLGHLDGVASSRDGGLTWRSPAGPDGLTGRRVRAILAEREAVWVATEDHLFEADPGRGVFDLVPDSVFGLGGAPAIRSMRMDRTEGVPAFPVLATSRGTYEPLLDGGAFFLRHYGSGNVYALLPWGGGLPTIAGTELGLTASLSGRPLLGAIDRGRRCAAARPSEAPPNCGTATEREPADPARAWLGRPVADADGNPYLDPTRPYGAPADGVPPHSGVDLNNPPGTPVRALGDGIVAAAGPREDGEVTIVVLYEGHPDGRGVYSEFRNVTGLEVAAGQRVRAGQILAAVGSPATPGRRHLHVEIHVAEPTDPANAAGETEDVADPAADPDGADKGRADPGRAGPVVPPRRTVNPYLWIEPLPGTGVIAGRVDDARGEPAPGIRIHGVAPAWPEETPSASVVTYAEGVRADPVYGENFAIGDLPEGGYRLYARVDGHDIAAFVQVEPGRVSWVELRP